MLETKQGYLALISGNSCIISLKSGELLHKNVPVFYLASPKSKHQVTFQQNSLFIGWQGLKGGGNCTKSSSLSPPKRLSQKSLSKKQSLIEEFSVDLFFAKENSKEQSIRKSLNIFKEKLILGIPNFSILKEIEEAKVDSTCNFFSIFAEILEILSLAEIYFKKSFSFARLRIAKLALRFLVYAKLTTQTFIDRGTVCYFKDIIKKAKNRIVNDIYSECSFECILICIEIIVDSFNASLPKQLSEFASSLLKDAFSGIFNHGSAVEYLKSSVNYGREAVYDLVLVELVDQNKGLEILKSMLGESLNLDWERVAIVLMKLDKNEDCLDLLGEYIYFSNYNIKDVWKIRCVSIEILFSYKGLFNGLEQTSDEILNEKNKQDDIDAVKNLIINKSIYLYSILVSHSNTHLKTTKSKLHVLPKTLQINLDVRNLEFLMNDSSKVLCVSGSRGCGKTALALSYAYSKLDYYSLIFFIPCESRSLMIQHYLKISKRLKLIVQDSLEDTIFAVKNYLETQNSLYLLIFDNVSSIKNVENLIPSNGHVIITSTTNICSLRYEIYDLNENAMKDLLNSYFSKTLCERLKGNYMGTCLMTKLLSFKEGDIDEVESFGENPLFEIFKLIIAKTEKKYKGVQKILFCLCLLENSCVPRELFMSILSILELRYYYYDILLYELGKYELIEENKGYTIILNSTFYCYLSESISEIEITDYVKLLIKLYCNLNNKPNFREKITKSESVLGLLKITCYLDKDFSFESGVIHYLKSKYEFQINHDIKKSISLLKHALLCQNLTETWKEEVSLALGYLYLKDFQIFDSISTLNSLKLLTPEQSLITFSYLLKAYDYTRDIKNIYELIKSNQFQHLSLPEAIYYLLQGICNLLVTDEELQDQLQPFTSFLYSRAPSILLLETLIRISSEFLTRENWRLVFFYLNLTTPLLQIDSVLVPKDFQEILKKLKDFLNLIQVKVRVLVREAHSLVVSLIGFSARVNELFEDFCECFRLSQKCFTIRIQVFGYKSIFVAESLYEMGKACLLRKESENNAEEHCLKAKEILEELGMEKYMLYGKVLELIGVGFYRKKEYLNALDFIKKARKLKKDICRDSGSYFDILENHYFLGKTKFKLDEKERALRLFKKAVFLCRRPSVLVKWPKTAVKLCEELKQPIECLSFLQVYIQNLELINNKHVSLYDSYLKAYKCSKQVQNYSEAQVFIEKSLNFLSENNREITISHLFTYSNILNKLGKYQESIDVINRALSLSLSNSGENSFETVHCKYKLAVVHILKNDFNGAIFHMKQLAEKTTGDLQGKIFKNLGICYLELKEFTIGYIELDKALMIFKQNNYFNEVAKVYKTYARYSREDKVICLDYLESAYKILVENLGESHLKSIKLKDLIKKTEE